MVGSEEEELRVLGLWKGRKGREAKREEDEEALLWEVEVEEMEVEGERGVTSSREEWC